MTRRFYQQGTDDRSCAGERDNNQRKGHQQNTEETAGAPCFAIQSGRPAIRQGDLEEPEERKRKNDQQQEEDDIHHRIGAEIVQGGGTE